MSDAARDFRNKKSAKQRDQQALLEKIGLGGIALLALLALFFFLSLFFGGGPKAENGKNTIFVVNSGANATLIGKELKEDRLLRSPFAFKTLVALTGSAKKFKPGEYQIPSGATPLKIIKILATGDALDHKITIPEGFPMVLVYERLKKNTVLDGDLPPMPLEGMVAPDTYNVQKGDTRAAIIEQMVKAQTKILDEAWLSRKANLPLKSKEEALILASIVEKETGVPEERAHIAAVFLNRLKEGMKLQSDPTIIYSITKGAPLGRKILRSEIDAKTDWNTYQMQGLPKTPICNPGKDAINAVLNPTESKDLYFVADGSGGHVFAATYEEHDKNVAKWRQFRANKEAQDTSDTATDLKGSK